MAMSLSTLKKLTKEELSNMVLEYQNRFENMLANVNTELSSLRDRKNGISAFSDKESERKFVKTKPYSEEKMCCK